MLQAADLTIRLNPADDVVIARVELAAGTTLVKEGNISVAARVPAGHKVAVRDLKSGQAVRRYNQIIGFATRDIRAGEHVHVQNLAMGISSATIPFSSEKKNPIHQPAGHLPGHRRGRRPVATRNYIGILTSVNCSATGGARHRRAFRKPADAYPTVDGVVASPTSRAAAWPPTARRSTCSGAPWPATRATRISTRCRWSAWAARRTRSTACSRRRRSSARQAARLHHPGKGGTSKAIREGVARIEAVLADGKQGEARAVPASH
jgi:altronate hydrolase